MQITNGSFSRTYKPADYEARTCTLSYVLDEGDDVDASIAFISAMCEKHARQMPPAQAVHAAPPVQIAPVEPARQTRTAKKPPVVETTARVEEVVPGTEAPAATAEVIPLPGNVASVEPSGETAPPSADTSAQTPSEAKEISNNDLNAAIGHARQVRHLSQDQIVAAREKVTKTPGMSVMQMDQEQRRAFLAELAALSPEI